MSSFDKTVKLACKPKAAAPKAKYLDPIIAATYSEEGAVHDVCKALSPRFREPNSIVVFKALIVLHTMIRNGATDNVLSYLSSEDVLKLRNVSTGQWEGYDTPKNLQNYAVYLDSRIRTYRDLKHDPVRVQSDSNRDIRVENSIEGSRTNGGSSRAPHRRQTVIGRKLGGMSVEKGLLRETKAVQRTIDTLLECKFYLDNLEDELNVTALRMLVKDLIILFQALNEGVINVLEQYFEMSHVDAETALAIYRKFCRQTEKVLEYLSVAQKLQNLLNVPIPNLKHAPVSLVSALEEYLNDSNFEQNRIEYKTAKKLADNNSKDGPPLPTNKTLGKDKATGSTPAASSSPQAGPSSSAPKVDKPISKESSQALVDFFSSIEEEQPSNNQMHQQQPVVNPFVQRQSMMMTGMFPQQPFGAPQVPQLPQQTGYIQPQYTAMPGAPTGQPNAFGQSPPPSHPSFSSFLQPQPTGFLQPQQTGSNPFRQSMMMPQMTGMLPFGGPAGVPGAGSQPFQSPGMGTPFSMPHPVGQTLSAQGTSFAPIAMPNGANASGAPGFGSPAQNVPPRPASTPITSNAKSFGQAMQPVVSHQTGSRNPFGEPTKTPPPVPKAPTLQELVTGSFGNKPSFGASNFGVQRAQSPPVQQQPQKSQSPTLRSFSPPFAPIAETPSTSSNATEGSGMSSIASSFTFNNNFSIGLNKPGTDTTGTQSVTSQPTSTSTFSSQPTGTSSATSAPLFSQSPLQPQTTGFTGLKPFKPTSSFGASLLESLPPIPQSGTSSPNAGAFSPTQPTGSGVGSPNGLSGGFPFSNGLTSNTTNAPSFSGLGSGSSSAVNGNTAPPAGGLSSMTTGFNSSTPGLGALNAQPTGLGGLPSFNGTSAFGSSLGGGLRPQTTGGGGLSNPFRASMLNPNPTGFGGGTTPAFGASPGVGSGFTPFSSTLGASATGANPPSFGASLFGGTTNDPTKQVNGQQNGVASLI